MSNKQWFKAYQWYDAKLKKNNDKFERIAVILLIIGVIGLMASRFVPWGISIVLVAASFVLDFKAWSIQREDKKLKALKKNNEI